MGLSWSHEEDTQLIQMMGYVGGTQIPTLPGARRDYQSWKEIALALQSYYLEAGRNTPRHYNADIVSSYWATEIRPRLVKEAAKLYGGGGDALRVGDPM
jgi:hypothetical protein